MTEDENAKPFIIEIYEDWADYPGWVEINLKDYDATYEHGSPRFTSREAAREWLDKFLDKFLDEEDEKRIAWWYEREAKVAKALSVRAARLKVLEEAGLLHDEMDLGDGPLHAAPVSYGKPVGISRKNYRVWLDDGKKCPTCGGRE